MKKVLIGAVIVICAALVYKILSFNMFRPDTEVISLVIRRHNKHRCGFCRHNKQLGDQEQ